MGFCQSCRLNNNYGDDIDTTLFYNKKYIVGYFYYKMYFMEFVFYERHQLCIDCFPF